LEFCCRRSLFICCARSPSSSASHEKKSVFAETLFFDDSFKKVAALGSAKLPVLRGVSTLFVVLKMEKEKSELRMIQAQLPG